MTRRKKETERHEAKKTAKKKKVAKTTTDDNDNEQLRDLRYAMGARADSAESLGKVVHGVGPGAEIQIKQEVAQAGETGEDEGVRYRVLETVNFLGVAIGDVVDMATVHRWSKSGIKIRIK